ncbi:glycoside hydrolase family 26 protein [Aeromicrobium sp.]|uniref:glycoside hydrolase family 26 protein n=1 Tax=Aeromicrobium sp. TaxID=1871063 RepID=UPI003D6A12AA
MVVHGVVLLSLSAWVMHGTAGDPPPTANVTGRLFDTTQQTQPTMPSSRWPTRSAMLRQPLALFGVSAPLVPSSRRALDAITDKAGRRPGLVQYFVNWDQDFRAETARRCLEQGAVPMVAWQPWAGRKKGTNQHNFRLARISAGRHDAYITRFATAVRDFERPVVLRFAHEMNGTWFPWSESRNGNTPGDYVRAWRHVHGIFTQVGASNVIWVWSPNIVRPVPDVALEPLYPGDRYVDWVGMVGYGNLRENTAGETFDRTIRHMRQFTDKRLLITETGARPGPQQAGWVRDLFRWVAGRRDIVGFIWFQYDNTKRTADWRFDVSPSTLTAFRDGLAGLSLASPTQR